MFSGRFGTPTVVHFCVALLISATLSAPWQELANAGLALGISGTGGLIYVAIVVRRARRQTNYTPVLEDRLWHGVLPFVAYAAIDLAGIELRGNPERALFVVATATVLLVFVGIHNAWDTVTYIAVQRGERQSEKETDGNSGASPLPTLVPGDHRKPNAPVGSLRLVKDFICN